MVIAVCLTATVLLLTPPGTAAAQEPDAFDTTFRPIVEEELVEIETVFAVSRQAAIVTYIPAEAVDIRSDVPIVVEALDDGFYLAISLDVRRVSQAVLTYDLPSGEARSDGDTRVNASLLSFFVWVDPFFATGSVRVVIPAGFDALIDPTLMQPTDGENGEVIWVADPVSDPDTFFFRVVARSESGLLETSVQVEGQTVTISAWADDPEWSAFTSDIVTRGVPLLTDLIGQPWPEDDLVVLESAVPSSEGYAGWYDLRESLIEVGDVLDQETMLHELSHAWFNSRLFGERWMVEGFAEEFSSRASSAMGGSPSPPSEPSTEVALDGLASWRSRLFFEDTWDIEYYGYDTSYYVMRMLSDEIGVEGLADAISGMVEGRLVYSRPDEPAVFPTNDWRRFLDMLERDGNSVEAAALFEAYVIPADQRSLLQLREESIAAYDQFVEETGELGVPRGIRDAMSRWKFTLAQGQIDDAREVVAELDLLHGRAAAADLTAPPYLADLYASSNGSFSTARAAIEDAHRALDAIELRGPSAPGHENDRANFERGRLEQIDFSVVVDSSALNQSETPGRSYIPYFAAIGVLLVLVAALSVVAARSTHEEVR